MNFSLSNSLPSNDNNVLTVCSACALHAAKVEDLCINCDGEMRDMMSQSYGFGDDEGELNLLGYNPGKL